MGRVSLPRKIDMIKKASSVESFLKMCLWGSSGSGKTYTALVLATRLASFTKKPILVIDSERGSSAKYSHIFDFFIYELSEFSPSKYEQAIKEGLKAGFGQIVIDSLSHCWAGKGGCLEMAEKFGGSFRGWAKVTPLISSLQDTILSAQAHVIATLRAKTQYEVDRDETTGKMTPRKLGLGPIFREGIEYEFDLSCCLDGGKLDVLKSRYKEVHNYSAFHEDGALIDKILNNK